MIPRWVAGIARFWYRFIVGDDWLLAAMVSVGVLAAWAAHRAALEAWWVLPMVVVAALSTSLRRAWRRTR